jgi:phosphoglycolate phosphatase-like HAD superfamily hydrolase
MKHQNGNTYIVFDLDGVLVDSYQALLDYHIQFEWLSKLEAAAKIETHFVTPNSSSETNLIIKQKMGNYLKHKSTIFHEFAKCVKKIDKLVASVATSSVKNYTDYFCDQMNIDFTHILTCQDYKDKSDNITEIAKRLGVKTTDLTLVTDTVRDYLETKDIVGQVLGVSWGYQSYKTLSQHIDPKFILNKYEDILDWF